MGDEYNIFMETDQSVLTSTNNRSIYSRLIYLFLTLSLLQFMAYQRLSSSIEETHYSLKGLKSISRYYDDFSTPSHFPYSLEGKIFCAQREGLTFQFQFTRDQLKSWVWSNQFKELYFSVDESAPTVVTSFQRKNMKLLWNISLMGKTYSFSALPYIFREGPSFLRGHSEVMREGPC